MARKKKSKSKYGKAVTGGKIHTVWNNREHVVDAIKRKGKKGVNPYAIANAGRTKAGRKRMAKKAAATRKRRRR